MSPKINKKLASTKSQTPEEKIQSDHSFQFCPEPTRFFEIGDKVIIGNLEDVVITNKYFNGKYYEVEYTNQPARWPKAGEPKEPWRSRDVWKWVFIYPRDHSNTQMYHNDNFSFKSYNSQLSSIINTYYSAGIDMNPVYQRGYEWTLEDKVKLIDSIFENAKIGLFVLNRRSFKETGALYEIVDGKQRLSAIIEFIEDRFEYKGVKWSQLHPRDRNAFKDHSIETAELEEASLKQIMGTFLKINHTGKVISEQHINKIKRLYEEEAE